MLIKNQEIKLINKTKYQKKPKLALKTEQNPQTGI